MAAKQLSRITAQVKTVFWHQYAGEYEESTNVVLSKVYTNHIDSATANILSYLKEVWGVATFDLFWVTESWSVFNTLQFLPFIGWQNVAMFCHCFQSSKKFNTIVFITPPTSPPDTQQSMRTAIQQPPWSFVMKCLPTCSGTVISTLSLNK